MTCLPELKRHKQYGHNPSQDKRRQELDVMNETVLLSGAIPDLLFLGDSLTQRWELGAWLHMHPGLVLNRGVGGDTSAMLLERFEVDVLQLRPRWVVIEAGVNDTWVLDGHGTETERADVRGVAERIRLHMENMVQTAVEHGIRVILGSIPPTGEVAWAPSLMRRNQVILQANEKLRAYCRQMQVPLADYHAAMVDSDGVTLRENLASDGIHPNGRGYGIMAGVMSALLKQIDWEGSLKTRGGNTAS